MEGYQRLFEHIDENGDGKISALELQQCVHLIGKDILLFEEAEAAIVAHDSDNDGLLDFDDFMRLVEDGGTEEEKERELKEAFRMYEMEGCGGCITPESLKRMLHRLGEKRTVDECRGMIARYDINGDGLLNFEEFVIMMHC